jgi:ATPase subunit of ABC transporter with duplicated ATPase domains
MLTINGLTVRLGGRTILDRASATIRPNSRVGLIGRNGAGKSSLLKILAGLEKPDDGTLQLQRSVVGLFQAGEDLEQRRLARAVAPDQADAFAGLQGEIGVIEQGHVAEGQLCVEEGNECHEGRDYPRSEWSGPSIV